MEKDYDSAYRLELDSQRLPLSLRLVAPTPATRPAMSGAEARKRKIQKQLRTMHAEGWIMKYYICQVREIVWSQPTALTQDELDLQHETLELTKTQFDQVLLSGVHVLVHPAMNYSDEFLDSLCWGDGYDVPTLH